MKKICTELYLSKKFISKDEWAHIIENITKYVGTLKKWEFVIDIDKRNVHYFLKTSRHLPTMMVGVSSCVLKEVDGIEPLAFKKGLPKFVEPSNSLADIVTQCSTKKDKDVIRFEIEVFALAKGIHRIKVYYYEKRDVVVKRRLIFQSLEDLLSVDFSKTDLFFYKKVPKYLDIQKLLHLLKSDEQNALFKVETFPYLNGNYYLNLSCYDFAKHSLVVGSSGSGKSKFLSLLIKRIMDNVDYQMKYKVIVIDPHAALEEDVGGLSGRVIDFKSDETSLDVFKKEGGEENLISSSELLLDLMKNLLKDGVNPKLERMLRQCINLLLSTGRFSFTRLRKLLLETEYRVNVIKENVSIINESTRDFFLKDFNDLKTKSYNETIAPIISFIDEMQLLPVFNKESEEDGIDEVIKESNLTIFSLDTEVLGNAIIRTLSGLVMKQIFEIAEARTIDKEMILVVDEVSVIENPVLIKILAEARKYGLHVVIAEQYLDQVSERLKNAIFANVSNYYLFRVSKRDAAVLASNVSMKIQNDDSEEARENILTGLNDRECIVRVLAGGKLLSAFKGKTVDFVSVPKKRIVINRPTVQLDERDRQIIEEKKFLLDGDVNLRELMIRQSSSKEDIGGMC